MPRVGAQEVDAVTEEVLLIERIDVRGNQFLQKETLLFYVSTKVGDRYDERRLQADFRRLWDTGFLEDMSIDVRKGAQGKVITFVVIERKRIQIVDYRGSKALTTSNIEDELKKKDAALRIDTFYSLAKARKVEEILREMLKEKGHPFGTAKHDAKTVGGAGTQVSFTITDGPKAKVKVVEFVGNTVFSDGALRGAFKKIKPSGFWNLSWLGGKSTYTEEKWSGQEGDRQRLQDFFLNRGYVTASVGEPRITYFGGKEGKKPSKFMKIEIPVTEGEQYRVGEVKFEGLTVFKEEGIRPIFKLRTGDIYKESQIKKGYDKLRDAYGAQGYMQWTPLTRRKSDPERKVVDITLSMEEDKRYFVGRITFTGNESTRDKVIRREIYLNEGDVFNTEMLKLSIRRVNQLGYFKPMEGAPDIQPSERGEDQLDVTFKVEEQNRNQFTFGGGVSGLEGTFVNASFSTANFLGKGETLTLSALTGGRSRTYQFSVSEPYFLDRPITAGFDVSLRRVTFQSYETVVGYSQQEQGLALTTGLPAGRFSRVFAGYSYQIIDLYGVDKGALERLTSTSEPSSGTPTLDPSALLANVGRRYESRITPSWVRNTVDNPYLPRRGTRNTATFQYVGGPLGGTVNYYRPTLESVAYRPFGRKMALGLRAEVGYTRAFGSTTEIPYYQRYFLGGETQIRGYNARTVSPLDPGTSAALGGNKYLLFNAEYYLDLFGPARFLLFYDAGEAYPEGKGFYWKTLRTSLGAELRFVMPVLNVPFRLIYAYNANRDYFQPRTAFKFAVGTTF